MVEQEYDLLVIGAGAAGGTAAFAAAEKKLKVALIERDKPGGTCLNYGCDPTKTMLRTAGLLTLVKKGHNYGVQVDKAELDWPRLLGYVENIQNKMRGGTIKESETQMSSKGIDFWMGEAYFISQHEVMVAGKILKAANILIATGTKAGVPPVEGLFETGFITNVEAVSLPSLPRRLGIIGGGPIGIEFSQIFRRFGVEVTVLEHSTHVLDTEDHEMGKSLVKRLMAEGVRFLTGIELKRVWKEPDGKHLVCTHEESSEAEELVFDELLVAAGREPVLEPLNLSAAGVETTKKGIKVDSMLRSNIPHIWAAGDITGGYPFTHVAEEQGKLVVENAFGKELKSFDDRVIPWVTYTQPELAHAGKTEEELKNDKVEYRVARFKLDQVARAVIEDDTEGMVKLLVGNDDQILGGHILAPGAGESIAAVVLAINANLKISELARVMLPYPTLTQAVKFAAEAL